MGDDTKDHVVLGGSPHEHRAVLVALAAVVEPGSSAGRGAAEGGEALDAFRRRRRDALRRRPETVRGRA